MFLFILVLFLFSISFSFMFSFSCRFLVSFSLLSRSSKRHHSRSLSLSHFVLYTTLLPFLTLNHYTLPLLSIRLSHFQLSTIITFSPFCCLSDSLSFISPPRPRCSLSDSVLFHLSITITFSLPLLYIRLLSFLILHHNNFLLHLLSIPLSHFHLSATIIFLSLPLLLSHSLDFTFPPQLFSPPTVHCPTLSLSHFRLFV